MELGLARLGRICANMSRRWLRAAHRVVGYARTRETVDRLLADGSISEGATALVDLVAQKTPPRILWLMVPVASVDATIEQVMPRLASGDILVDGGNSLHEPELYQHKLDISAVAELRRRGSVAASWHLDLTAQALRQSPDLGEFAGRVSDSGERRWTSIAAIDVIAPAPVITTSRFTSRGASDYGDLVLSAMRFGFGGHLRKASHAAPPQGAANR